MPQIEHNHPEGKREYVQKDMSGSLFINRNKSKDTAPDMTGDVTINGKKWRIAAWNKTSKGNTQYLSLNFSEPLPPREGSGQVATPEATVSSLMKELGAITGGKKYDGDNIPF